MKKICAYVSIIAGIFTLCCCGREDDDNTGNNSNNLTGSCQAVIDGSNWQADSSKVLVVIANYGTGPLIGVTAVRSTDSSFFSFLVPYFYGNDTVIVTPAAVGSELRFTYNNIWIADPGPGNISISRSVTNGVETYTGTFSGNFTAPIGGSVKVITNGVFNAKRLL